MSRVPTAGEATASFASQAALDAVATDVLTVESTVSVIREAPLNVEYPEYGASPAASASANATAIQAAVDALPNGGELLLPRMYPTNATVSAAAGRILAGTGLGSGIAYTGTGNAVHLGSNTLSVDDPNTGGGLRNMQITGTASGAAGVRLRGITRFFLDDLRIDGFTAGDGLKFYGASFIGRVMGGRIQDCLRGVSAKKEAGFGDAGEGMALNAVEFSGGLELQNCGTAMEIGDPAVTETGSVVALAVEIHGVTVENCTKGIWNVGGNLVNIHDCYLEDNTDFDIRIGSTSGNTSIPVMCCISHNFINPRSVAIQVLRGLHTRIDPNYILGIPADTTTGVSLAAGAASTITRPQFFNTIDTEYSDSGAGNVLETLQGDAIRTNAGLRALGTINAGAYLQSYEGSTAAILLGNNGGQPGIFLGNLQDVVATRAGTAVPTWKFNNPVTFQTYTVATRPAAADVTQGTVIHVSDGAAGAKFQGSSGGAWVNLG